MRFIRSSLSLLGLASYSQAARNWHNTNGSIIFEEAVSLPFPELPLTVVAPILGQTMADLNANLEDIHNQRLKWMDESGVDYMVLSCTSPCIQGVSDPTTAATVAVQANDYLANLISNNTARFGAFAALAMHNATVAAEELRRTVQEYGFLGALLNDYQQAGPDNTTLYYYDQPEYDAFWKVVQELDVPVYMHPRTPVTLIEKLSFDHASWLMGAPHQFAVELSNHVVGLCTNGVFDRFPNLKVIVGHMGERIPSDIWRIDTMLARKVPQGMPMNKTVLEYFKTNIYETTSGNFWTPLFDFHRSLLGLDRILYSVDYPFNTMKSGADWIRDLPLKAAEKHALIRGNAIKLLGLDKK